MNQDVQVVELVVPEGMRQAPEPPPVESGSWWIAALVGAVLAGNAALVWWRIRRRDPLKSAFEGAASSLGLTRAERRRVVELSEGRAAPVAMLICGSALDEVKADDPLIVSVRRKMKAASG